MDYNMLIADMAGNTGCQKEQALEYAATIVMWITQQVVEEGELVVNDFGKFQVEKHKEFVYLDTAQQKRWLVPPALSLRFIPVPLLENEEDKGKTIPVIADIIEKKHKEKPIQARKFAVMFFKTILDAMEGGEAVQVEGLGTFLLTKVKTGDSIYGKVSYNPDENLTTAINRPFAYFQPVELNEGVEFDDVETTTRRTPEDKGDDVFLIYKEAAETEAENQTEVPESSEHSSSITRNDASEDDVQQDGQTVSAILDTSHSLDSQDEPSPHTKWIKYALASVLGLVCVAAIVFYMGGLESRNERDALVTDEKTAVVTDGTDKKGMGQNSEEAEGADDINNTSSVVVQDSDPAQLDFAKMNAQLPYCGYDIVGVASTITVTKGLTLEQIAKCYLGTDYTQYLVVLNGGNDNPQPGQKYMIPKLQLRKK